MSKDKKKKNPSSDENSLKPKISTHPSENTEKSIEKNIRVPENKKPDMEAYHSHGKQHNRKFKDFIFEFIMIFIAISGGFFMENLREHFVDRNKEKEYIVRLIKDIQNDTAKIRNIRQWNQKQTKGLDSLANLLEKPITEINTDELVRQMYKYLNNYKGFNTRDITITQLKNSGGLRLIGNTSVSDSIVSYYSNIEYRHELNVKMNYRFLEESLKKELDLIDLKNNRFLVINANKMTELVNRCLLFKLQLEWDNVWLNDVYNQGISLLKYLKKEYNITE